MILTQKETKLKIIGQKFPGGDELEATTLSLKKIRIEILTLRLAHCVTLIYVPNHSVPELLSL